MPATLTYDLSVIGFNKVDAAFANVERRASVHNQRMVRGRGRGAYRTNAVNTAAEETAEARLLNLRNRYHAAAVAYHKKLETTRHKEKLRNIEREKQAEIAAARQARARAAMANRAMRGAVGRAALGSVASIGRGAMTVGAMGGTAIIASGVAKQINVSKSTAALANKAFGTPGETRSRKQIQTSLLEQSKQIGDVTGDRAGVIEALNKVVGISGSLKAGQQMAGFMANLSDASGARMEDIGQTSGIILQNLAATRGYDLSKQDDLDAAVDATQRIMGRMAGQAKIGSIEFEQLATQMASVMSATGRFEGDIEDLAAQMGAIGQLAIAGGASSPEEAMTALKRFSDDIVRNSGRFKKLAAAAGIKTEGVFVKNAEGKRVALKDPTKLIMEMMKVTGGDLPSVQKVFNIRSMKAFEPFQKAFVTAKEKSFRKEYAAAKAGGATDQEATAIAKKRAASDEEAFTAIQSQMDRFRAANMTQPEMKRSAEFARAQPGRSFQIEWERLTQQVGEDLTPALVELLPSVRDLFSTVKDGVPYVKWFFNQLAANPMGTIGKVLAARVAFDVGKAAIGQVIARAITGQVAASGVASSLGQVGVAATGAKTGLAALAGPLGILAASVLALNVILGEMGAGVGKGSDDRLKRGVEGTNLVSEAKARLRSGKALTEEQRTALTEYSKGVDESARARDEAMQHTSVGGVAKTLAASVGLAEGPGVMQTMANLSGGPSEVDVRNKAEIDTILKLDAAAQKSTDAAANQTRAAIELRATAIAIKNALSTVPRGNQPAPPKVPSG